MAPVASAISAASSLTSPIVRRPPDTIRREQRLRFILEEGLVGRREYLANSGVYGICCDFGAFQKALAGHSIIRHLLQGSGAISHVGLERQPAPVDDFDRSFTRQFTGTENNRLIGVLLQLDQVLALAYEGNAMAAGTYSDHGIDVRRILEHLVEPGVADLSDSLRRSVDWILRCSIGR